MKQRKNIALLLVTILVACSAMDREPVSVPIGTLVLETIPNPLIAKSLGSGEFEIAFLLTMREEGGVDTRIESFTVEAVTIGGLVVRTETHGPGFITARGFPADVDAGQLLQFEFVKRWKLPTDLLMKGAGVRVTARTIDANGRRNTSSYRADVRVLR